MRLDQLRGQVLYHLQQTQSHQQPVFIISEKLFKKLFNLPYRGLGRKRTNKQALHLGYEFFAARRFYAIATQLKLTFFSLADQGIAPNLHDCRSVGGRSLQH